MGKNPFSLYGGAKIASRHDSDALEPMFVEMMSRGHESETLVAATLYGGADKARLAADNGSKLIFPANPAKKSPPPNRGVGGGVQDTADAEGSGKLSFKRLRL
jgi:hypothetical protein